MRQRPWIAHAGDTVREVMSQRRWLLLPIPLVLGNLLAYRGPYLITGTYVTTYLLATTVIVADLALLYYRNNHPWMGPTSLLVIALVGGVLS
ncbi:MAG TPA: hypothetical protein VGM75_09165, partial [Pseudonocardiaceae bacterium]